MIKANLTNNQGCMFDKGEFDTLAQVQTWAIGRGECNLNVFEEGQEPWSYYFDGISQGLEETYDAIGCLFILAEGIM